MAYVLHIIPHPLGVVVSNAFEDRELLIEGESCCDIEYRDLLFIADTTGKVEVGEAHAGKCRLLRSAGR